MGFDVSRAAARLGAISLATAALTGVLTLLACFASDAPFAPRQPAERYVPALSSSVRDLNSAMAALPRYLPRDWKPTQRDVAAAIELLLRDRFYHGYSEYTFAENWPAFLAGYVWADLRSPVSPDEILRHPWAGCSQQAIVFQAMLQRSHIRFASLRVKNPPHFATVAEIAGRWYLTDSWDELPRSELGPISLELIRGRGGQPMFPGQVGRAFWRAMNEGAFQIADENRFPARHAMVFDVATHWFSRWGWALLLVFSLAMRFARQSAQPPTQVRPPLRPASELH